MGNQPGNLRAQLVKDGICPNLKAAKDRIRRDLEELIFLLADAKERALFEHFMIAVLRPRHSDENPLTRERQICQFLFGGFFY
ncbi:MAG: hypothetical protein ACYCT9_03020 [Leptospirillum sp.]|jgi:hypothetical protein